MESRPQAQPDAGIPHGYAMEFGTGRLVPVNRRMAAGRTVVQPQPPRRRRG